MWGSLPGRGPASKVNFSSADARAHSRALENYFLCHIGASALSKSTPEKENRDQHIDR